MDSGDYTVAWVVYGLAAAGFALLGWRVLRKLRSRGLAWLLESWLLALLFTPWYVQANDTLLAPALIVFVMDFITIGPESAIRALIPLIMTLFLGLLLSTGMVIVSHLWRRRRAS